MVLGPLTLAACWEVKTSLFPKTRGMGWGGGVPGSFFRGGPGTRAVRAQRAAAASRQGGTLELWIAGVGATRERTRV